MDQLRRTNVNKIKYKLKIANANESEELYPYRTTVGPFGCGPVGHIYSIGPPSPMRRALVDSTTPWTAPIRSRTTSNY